jgi:hypothetical protein
MSWSKFTIVIAICYVAYYSFNIIFDMLKGNSSVASASGGDVLTFTEDIQTTYVEDEIEVVPKRVIISNRDSDKKDEVLEPVGDNMDELGTVMENINTSTGGVISMSDIIKLAQNDTIEFKRSLVF